MKKTKSVKFIVPQSPLSNPVFLKLSKYVRDCQLSTALNFLEKRNISGDVAIFVIANMQKLEGAK